MATLPEYLDRSSHVDLHGRNVEPWFRRIAGALVLVVCCLGLANVFGQKTHTLAVDSAAARLSVETSDRARGGLIYQATFRIDAHRALTNATLVLDPGWFDGLTINTVEPDAVEWGQRNGRNTLALGPIEAGAFYVLRLQYQVNPTHIGRRSQNVELDDGAVRLLTLDHTQTIFP